MIEYKIYGLVCPIINEVRYIGYTYQELETRLKQHMREINRCEITHKINWLRKLKKQNLKPTITLIKDKIQGVEKACYYERLYIKMYNNLVNSTNGGEKNKVFCDTVIEKISNSLKEYYETNDVWNKGKKGLQSRSDELKQKQSLLMSGENNSMFGKNIFDIWKEKYDEETYIKMVKDFSLKNKKYDYDYNKLYDMFIIKDMKQTEISNEIGMSKSQICRVLKKFGLTELKNKKKI